MTWDDPIVEEVRRIRTELWKKYGGLEGYFKHLVELQEEHPEDLVDAETLKKMRENAKTP